MDYVDFIVHVFSAEKRAFYGLERLRKSATTISVAELNAEVSARITEARAKKNAAAAKKASSKSALKKVATKLPGRKTAQKKTTRTKPR
jgi:ribosome-associated protein